MSELNLNIEPIQFKRILVGVDESEQGYVALANAIHQASEDDAHLIIASVLEMDDLSTIDALHLDAIKERRATIEANLAKYAAYAKSKVLKTSQLSLRMVTRLVKYCCKTWRQKFRRT